ncbi:MAG: helix-turn-helix domain-containing protein [Pseudonocardiales bacterium]
MSDKGGRTATVRRRQLGLELRRLREAAGKTPKEAADWLVLSTSTLSKIELGRHAIKGSHVRLLTQLYGVEAPESDTLMRRAQEANQRSWWAVYGDTVPDWARTYLDLEGDASELWVYESGLIFGPFQTPAYAEAIMSATLPKANAAALAKLVELRAARQERLIGDRAPTLRVMLDEAVLHRMVGGAEVMREQLTHLIEVAQLPHVDLGVQPFSTGAHPAIGAPLTLLRFADTEEINCVYLENQCGALYLERPSDLEHYTAVFERLSATALWGEEALRLVTRLVSRASEQ